MSIRTQDYRAIMAEIFSLQLLKVAYLRLPTFFVMVSVRSASVGRVTEACLLLLEHEPADGGHENLALKKN